jgi:hypothetical protein
MAGALVLGVSALYVVIRPRNVTEDVLAAVDQEV